MIEFTEQETCILIDALNKKVNAENDVNDYTAIFNKLHGQLDLIDLNEKVQK